MRFYLNTDTVDIDAKSIGVHNDSQLPDREFCIQIRHSGTKESVEEATKIGCLIVASTDLLEACKRSYDILRTNRPSDAPSHEYAMKLLANAIAKASE